MKLALEKYRVLPASNHVPVTTAATRNFVAETFVVHVSEWYGDGTQHDVASVFKDQIK